MSALADLESAVRAELAKPATRQAIEGVEDVVLQSILRVMESLIPAWLRPFVGGLVDSLAEKGIHGLEQLTDKTLANLVVPVTQPLKDAQGHLVGTASLSLRIVHPDIPLTAVDTVADWPGPKE